MNTHDRDDLDRTLTSADPAASLSPLSPARFDRLMKDTTMTENTVPSAPTRTRFIPVIAGGLAAAAIATFAVIASQPAAAPTVLDAGPQIAAKCAEVTPASFVDVDLAFAADVTSIDGDVVTLAVTDRYTGEVGGTVVTTQGDGAISDGGPLVYEAGQTYLIASVDGRVLSCGQSGIETPELASIYDAAF